MLEKYIERRIFLVWMPEQNDSEGRFLVFDAAKGTNVWLACQETEYVDSIRVFNGYLSPACVIPEDLDLNELYVIFETREKFGEGYIIDVGRPTSGSLINSIESVILTQARQDAPRGPGEKQIIDNMYVLYGSELTVKIDRENYERLYIDGDEADESQLYEAVQTVSLARRLRKTSRAK